MMIFNPLPIAGVFKASLVRQFDHRGSLIELFRADELPSGFKPVMGYASLSFSDVTRGPHEHKEQTDLFCFLLGPFRVWLLDNRPASPTFGSSHTEVMDAALIVPPGVAHAYRNIGSEPGIVLNFPNRLYAGEGRRKEVDEIRHEGTELAKRMLKL